MAGLAVAAEPGLEVEVPQDRLTVGDRVVARVKARGGDGLLWGDLTVAVEPDGPWELVDGPRAVPGSEPPMWEVTLVAMRLGDLPLPTAEVTVRSPTGDTLRVPAEHPPTVTVDSILEEGDPADPAPMRDPVGAHGFPWEWVVPGLVAGVPVAAVLGLWLLRRRRPATDELAAPAVPPLDELEALVTALRSGIGREPEDGVCDRLAAGLRRYLERRTGEPALEMTTAELRLLARQRGWPEGVQRGVQSVMGVADGVRFGRRAVGEGSLRAAVDGVLAAGRELETHLTPSPGREPEATA